jgi:hypothetical protein
MVVISALTKEFSLDAGDAFVVEVDDAVFQMVLGSAI